MPEISRRDLLKIARNGILYLSGTLALGGLLRFLGFQPDPAPVKTYDLGRAEGYPVGSRTVIPTVPALLIHTEVGFSALSLVCTHLGCIVETKEDGFACPCHGSLYTRDGSLLRGPAARPLTALRIETTKKGNLVLHTD
jgi:cytochrome b6-f complex iron-sulfur subunit